MCLVGCWCDCCCILVGWLDSSDIGCPLDQDRLCEGAAATEGRYQPERQGQSLNIQISLIKYKNTIKLANYDSIFSNGVFIKTVLAKNKDILVMTAYIH